MFACITVQGIVLCCDRRWISSTTNKSYRKIIWLSWNCVSTIPQVRTRTRRTSTSVGTYLGVMIRFMFSKKLEQAKRSAVWVFNIYYSYYLSSFSDKRCEICVSISINWYLFHPVASDTVVFDFFRAHKNKTAHLCMLNLVSSCMKLQIVPFI